MKSSCQWTSNDRSNFDETRLGVRENSSPPAFDLSGGVPHTEANYVGSSLAGPERTIPHVEPGFGISGCR